MSNYRDSEMHKSIMREKAKQDAGNAAAKKKKAPAAAKSGFVKKAGSDLGNAMDNALAQRKKMGNIVGSAARSVADRLKK